MKAVPVVVALPQSLQIVRPMEGDHITYYSIQDTLENALFN